MISARTREVLAALEHLQKMHKRRISVAELVAETGRPPRWCSDTLYIAERAGHASHEGAGRGGKWGLTFTGARALSETEGMPCTRSEKIDSHYSTR